MRGIRSYVSADHARDRVEEGLRHSGVGLVTARRAHALVLVVDMGGRLQGLLQPGRAQQRGGAPNATGNRGAARGN